MVDIHSQMLNKDASTLTDDNAYLDYRAKIWQNARLCMIGLQKKVQSSTKY
jgi:hypothetical protein